MKEKNKTNTLWIRFLFIFVLSFISVNHVNARPLFIFQYGDAVSVIKELPEDYTIATTDGDIHVDLGTIYKKFSIFWIPVWNWNVDKYVLLPDDYDKDDKNIKYYDVDEEELSKLRNVVGELPDKPELSFWKRFGGKLIILLIIALMVVGGKSSNGADASESSESSKE